MSFHVPERFRVPRWGGVAGTNDGAFALPAVVPGRPLAAIASFGAGWDHVSVSVRLGNMKTRIPTWGEMAYVKGLFWDPEDAVMELHPRVSQYVNHHGSVLHLWRPNSPGVEIPEPPPELVGGGPVDSAANQPAAPLNPRAASALLALAAIAVTDKP